MLYDPLADNDFEHKKKELTRWTTEDLGKYFFKLYCMQETPEYTLPDRFLEDVGIVCGVLHERPLTSLLEVDQLFEEKAREESTKEFGNPGFFRAGQRYYQNMVLTPKVARGIAITIPTHVLNGGKNIPPSTSRRT